MNAAPALMLEPETRDLVPGLHVESISLAKKIVAAGDGVAALPLVLVASELADGSLTALDWRPEWLHTKYGFVYPRDRTLSPAARAFIEEVRAVEAELPDQSTGKPKRAFISPYSTRVSNIAP